MSAVDSVGVVGVGNMGGAMAARLLALGWTVRVRDIVQQKVQALAGATACDSPREVADGCSAVIVCVVDAAQVREVLFGKDGVVEAWRRSPHSSPASPGTVVLCPTIAPGDTESIASELATHGADCIDAPMSGGPARARDGTMSLMVACSEEAFARHRRLLECLSQKLFRVSARPGDGARTKLVNNLLAGINLAGAAEAMALAQRMGLDLARTLDVIEQSSGQSWIGSDRMRRALAGDYAPRAHVTLLQKDTRLAIEAARTVGFEGPLGPAAQAVFERAAAAGLADLDDAALFKLLSGT